MLCGGVEGLVDADHDFAGVESAFSGWNGTP
jgi:hypothetical protein